MARVPVAVVIKAARLLQHPCQLHATRPHELDIRLRRLVPVLERPSLLRLAPEHLIVPVRIERRIDVDQIDARIRQLLKLLQIVAAINDPRVQQRRTLSHGYAPAYILPPRDYALDSSPPPFLKARHAERSRSAEPKAPEGARPATAARTVLPTNPNAPNPCHACALCRA